MLSKSGTIAALLVGALALAAGWEFVTILVGFFVTSTALSLFRKPDKHKLLAGVVAKGNGRDAIQVFANGGVFALGCLWFILAQDPVAIFVSIGALAAATADTWATELGSLSPVEPRSVLTGCKVPPGTSGGISLAGTAAALAGSIFIGFLGATAGWQDAFIPSVAGGLIGSSADSLIGATLQARRFCPDCELHTEREVHLCGAATFHVSGISWINNDAVNLFCTIVGAGTAALWVL